MSELEQTAKRLGLTAMRALDISDAHNTDAMMQALSKTAFTGRKLGEAVDVAEAMFRDDCWVVLTLSGAMTMAGLNPLIMLMIEKGWIHAIVATGALVGHGLVEDLGMPHYKHKEGITDEAYFDARLNRVYDVLEPEDNLDMLEARIRLILAELADEREEPLGTHALLAEIGRRLDGRGVLQSAVEHGVDIFIPAFTDSELGLDFAVHRTIRRRAGKRPLAYDAFADLRHFRRQAEAQTKAGRKLGIFTIGGGVPRNWAQQVGPYVDIRSKRLKEERPRVRYSYGIRICPDPVHYGHLSGCTYSEGVSWGKFESRQDGGRYAEVLLDATVGWPLIARALIERGL